MAKAIGFSEEVTAEYIALAARFSHTSSEFRLGCAEDLTAPPRWLTPKGAGGTTRAELPCLDGAAGRFVDAFRELAEGATTAVSSEAGLMRALAGSYVEAVAEAVLPQGCASHRFARSCEVCGLW